MSTATVSEKRPAAAPAAGVTEQEARQVAEAARETDWNKPSFVRELFLGRLRLDLLYPLPVPDPEERARAATFLATLREFGRTVDGDEIERTGKVPDSVIQGLREIGAFGIKIPQEYGGLGLSQTSYNRAIAQISTCCGALGVLLSAHQSIGVPQPLKMFGTAEQKKKYLPRLAQGDISAFALTEPEVGSDPARMEATAVLTEDGSEYVLNGEKLWCTNGPIADVMVVMARTPSREGRRPGITAFIVEADSPGVEHTSRLEFMGLRGIENGVIRFRDVRVPRENVIWDEGKGLKLALITLNTGRLTIPATTAAAARWCLGVARKWSAERVQWGQPVGRHDAVAQLIGHIAATTFAMDSVNDVAAGLADAGKSDIRLEAAIAKMYNSEAGWQIVDETMQIRGGRGYETADSLRSRGEEGVPLERVMRDLRINLIFEGSSEIMRLFIAREAVDPHLERAGAMLDPKAGLGARLGGLSRLGLHVAGWYPGLVFGWGWWPRYSNFGALAKHLRFVERRSRKLGRMLLYAMTRHGARLEKRQSVLFRLVDVGAELFAMTAACVQAQTMVASNPADTSPVELADVFCKQARRRVSSAFGKVFHNDDGATYRLAQQTLKGRYVWLEED